MPTTLRLAPEIEERYRRLAERTHRPQSFYLRRALEESIGRLEAEEADAEELQAIVRQWRAGERKTYSLAEVREELGLDS